MWLALKRWHKAIHSLQSSSSLKEQLPTPPMQVIAHPLRRSASLLAAVAVLGWLVLRADTGQSAPTAPVDPPTDAVFAAKVRPMIARYCLGCHSTKVKKGDLDLERFSSLEVARHDLKPWQSVIEMLTAEEMPPKAKPQPTAEGATG